MVVTSDPLSSKIIDFISVLHRCLSETTFSQDRRFYESDIAAAAGWLVELHRGEQPAKVIREILDLSTAKQFTDCWRQGPWGDLQSKAFCSLQNDVRKDLEF